ncbi:MAG: D-alanyl-D-alanine carboxypeptidase family protein [Bacillota bacterium]|nr:D-alanyl-D-alanine carboxypeptidase family protein [Bacillota bacterium]
MRSGFRMVGRSVTGAGRRLLAGLLALLFLLPAAWIAPAAQAQTPPPVRGNPLSLKAAAAELLDVRTGQVLYAYNEHAKMQPASLAKLMTFLLALKALKDGVVTPRTQVTISQQAWQLSLNDTVSRMFVRVGDRVPFDTLLYGLMVASGNDAAVAVAEQLGGTEANFVRMMNAEARQLGLEDTYYLNSHGLYAAGQTTSAADVAKLSAYILNHFPDATKYTKPATFSYQPSGAPQPITQQNWNGLVITDRRVDGLKTGHLEESGYHLAASARSGSMQLVAVVMGIQAPTLQAGMQEREREAEALLNWGFDNFTTVTPDLHGKLPASIPVYKGAAGSVQPVPAAPLLLTVPRQDARSLSVQVALPSRLIAPVRKGQPLGEIVLKAGSASWKIPLVARGAVPRGNFLRVLWDTFRLAVGDLLARIHL